MVEASMASPPSLVHLERDAPRWVQRRSLTAEGHCPRWPFDYVDLTTGAMWPASCKSIRCLVCGPREASKRAWRAAAARPERFVTLTKLADDFQEARRSEHRLVKLIRRRGYQWEWCISHELTRSGLRHAHALQKGDPIPQRELSALAERAGMGRIVDIRRIRTAGAASYALKEALTVVGYATKGTARLDEHLQLNGGRMYRVSRGYWREA